MTSADRNESATRNELIDTQLARAGWSTGRRTLVKEFLLKAAETEGTYGDDQFADYVLLGTDGKPLAVVELYCFRYELHALSASSRCSDPGYSGLPDSVPGDHDCQRPATDCYFPE